MFLWGFRHIPVGQHSNRVDFVFLYMQRHGRKRDTMKANNQQRKCIQELSIHGVGSSIPVKVFTPFVKMQKVVLMSFTKKSLSFPRFQNGFSYSNFV